MTTAATQHVSRRMRRLVVVSCVLSLSLGLCLSLVLSTHKRTSEAWVPTPLESRSLHGLNLKSPKATFLLCSSVATKLVLPTDDRALVCNDFLCAGF